MMKTTAPALHKLSPSPLPSSPPPPSLSPSGEVRTASLSVLVVDDHPLMCLALRGLLQTHFPGVEVSEVHSHVMAIEKLVGGGFDLAIVDINLPGRSGLELVTEIKRLNSKLPTVVYSLHNASHFTIDAYRRGAWAYVRKDEGSAELVSAIRTVLKGQRHVSPTNAGMLAGVIAGDVEGLPHGMLSERERQVLQWVGSGLSQKEVGAKLDINLKTVATYQARVLKKLGLRSGKELIRYCFENGIHPG